MKIINGLVFDEKCEFNKKDVFIEDDLFVNSAEGDVIDAEGCYVVPGFIDVHTHGALNHDFCDGDKKSIEIVSEHLAKNGITSFFATTMTVPVDIIEDSLEIISQFAPNSNQSNCLGAHLEGPFFNGQKKGAQREDLIIPPSVDLYKKWQKISGNKIKMISIAPEAEGGFEFIKAIKDECIVSIGHSSLNYEQAQKAFDCGAKHVTHLYNAMNGIHHRDPNIIGAAYDNGIYVEIICDGFHIHPSVIRMTNKLFDDKMIFVSDAISSTGLSDGDYDLEGLLVHVKDGKCQLDDGTIAGSSISLHDALVRSVEFGVSLENAIKALTINTAKSIGVEDKIGSISEGKIADCVILNKDLSIKNVILRGEVLKQN